MPTLNEATLGSSVYALLYLHLHKHVVDTRQNSGKVAGTIHQWIENMSREASVYSLSLLPRTQKVRLYLQLLCVNW